MNDTELKPENQIEERENNRFGDRMRTSRDLHRQELSPGDIAKHDQEEAYRRDKAKGGTPTSDAVDEARRKDNMSNFANNFTGGDKKVRLGVGGAFKKFGPSGAIIGAVFAGLFGINTVLGPAMLLNHVSAAMMSKFNTQETSSSIRTKMVIGLKVNQETTKSCQITTILCRFQTPSNRILSQMEKNGITALDKGGDPVGRTGLWPNKRPSRFEFTDSAGNKLSITADKLVDTLDKNPEFAKAFRGAYNTRFESMVDSVAKKVIAHFGGTKADKMKNVTDEDSAKKAANEASAGEDVGAAAAKKEGAAAAEGVVDKMAQEEVKDSLEKVGKSGKGNLVGSVAGVVCVGLNAPGMISKIVRAYQLAQLVKYAMVFMTVADAIKAGTATPEEVSAVGNIMTNTKVDSSGNLLSGAFVASFGVLYAITGSTGKSGFKQDYSKFVPGGEVGKLLGGIDQFTGSKEVKTSCDVATSPATGLAIDAATSGTILGPLINLAGGLIIGTIIEKAAPYVAGLVGPAVAGFAKDIMSMLMPDLTKDLFGEDAGNAFTSGISGLLSTMANAGGCMALAFSQLFGYQQLTEKVQLAYAAEQRVGASPFDISNPYTPMGSIATQLIPTYGKMSSPYAAITSLASLALGGIPKFLATTPAGALDMSQYQMCNDPAIGKDIAADPFCNVMYGIPADYVGISPEEVVNTLANDNQIDKETGEPIPESDYEMWLSICTAGSVSDASRCQIVDKKHAIYALYQVDHRIQKTMDGEDTTTENTSPTTGVSGPVKAIDGLPKDGVKTTQEAWKIAQQFINDLNSLRKSKGLAPVPDIKDDTLEGYSNAAGTPGAQIHGEGCFPDTENCDQCYGLTAWFVNKYTSLTMGATPVNGRSAGDGVVNFLVKQGLQQDSQASVYSVFSQGRFVGDSGAHTGIVVGIVNGEAITIENNYGIGDGQLIVRKTSPNGDPGMFAKRKTVFTNVTSKFMASPKTY